MSWPKLHIQRNSFFFRFHGAFATLNTIRGNNFLTKEEINKATEAYAILKNLYDNRYKRYWELKEELENDNKNI